MGAMDEDDNGDWVQFLAPNKRSLIGGSIALISRKGPGQRVEFMQETARGLDQKGYSGKVFVGVEKTAKVYQH